MMNGPIIIRWREFDPAEQADRGDRRSSNWTKVHISPDGKHDSGARTMCGLTIPDMPYIADMDSQVPSDAPRCRRCAALVSEAIARKLRAEQ